MFSWLWSFFSSWGASHNNRLVFIGLDNAGKTTLLGLMHEERLRSPAPTVYPGKEEIKIGNEPFQAFDLGGHEAARRLWDEYMAGTDGLVFVVDAGDPARFEEAKKELNRVMTMDNQIAILVLGNKVDLASAVSEAELRERLGLWGTTTGKEANKSKSFFSSYFPSFFSSPSPSSSPSFQRRPVELFMCSFFLRQGYKEGFEWLVSNM
eukprot:TRINITY_DN3667_c0_g1_i1.p1 TRINITY_DN3667_c0_g1~~TRINITY_DN3667_c0_g1_i1.p1  ORF type:complete len:208 (-),score=55.24 TRINITY_DN3667_c0_g1_i1:130-753(-)